VTALGCLRRGFEGAPKLHQLNTDKSDAFIMGTANQQLAAPSLTLLEITGVNLPVADDIKILGSRCRPAFDVQQSRLSCNYHAPAIHHIRHLLTPDLAQTLACRLILSRIDY